MEKRKIEPKKILNAIRTWTIRTAFLLFAGSLLSVILLRTFPVFLTPLMLIRTCEQIKNGRPAKLIHQWKPLSKIAQPMVLAVVASEDNRFLNHHGFDFEQIISARKEAAKGKRIRGASTISQQTAKNVFLWPGRTYFRKALEAYFTILIELIWGKERIMEVYLNSIEMGDGIYGAEAAAKIFFNKPAAGLTRSEAALIAASLPDPRRLNAAHPSQYVQKRQMQILSLMNKVGIIKMGL